MHLKWIFSFIVALICTSCVHENFDNKEIAIGSSLPAFRAVINDSSIVNTSMLDDKSWIIVFFNTSCSDCRRELPMVQQLYDEYASYTHFLVIAREENQSSIQQFWDSNHLTMPYSPQQDRYIYSLFAQSGIPRIYLANSLGIITNCLTISFSYDEISSYIRNNITTSSFVSYQR